MSDNDIIKALEHCTSSTTSETCNGCPLFGTTICTEMENGLAIYALDLIIRQKAEIERLKRYDEERDIRLHARLTETARVEAIKEFAERLKERVMKYTEYDDGGWDSTIYVVKVEDIYSIVKEMTEE